jgi:hypothetical protein
MLTNWQIFITCINSIMIKSWDFMTTNKAGELSRKIRKLL